MADPSVSFSLIKSKAVSKSRLLTTTASDASRASYRLGQPSLPPAPHDARRVRGGGRGDRGSGITLAPLIAQRWGPTREPHGSGAGFRRLAWPPPRPGLGCGACNGVVVPGGRSRGRGSGPGQEENAGRFQNARTPHRPDSLPSALRGLASSSPGSSGRPPRSLRGCTHGGAHICTGGTAGGTPAGRLFVTCLSALARAGNRQTDNHPAVASARAANKTPTRVSVFRPSSRESLRGCRAGTRESLAG